ncbi:MAG TPA: hypothetical protein VGH37_08795 [Candidatus Acidoferrum sp.]|jgi:hypothetical protein
MQRFIVILLCVIGVFEATAHGQNTNRNIKVEPIHAQFGTVLTFYLQTRFNPVDRNEIDVLPKGTVLRVKMLNVVDSGVDPDGAMFHGTIVDSIATANEVLIHSESEVRGILVLLRSRSHPEGFRYELLLTGLTDHGKTYDLTASLNPSFLDVGAPRSPNSGRGASHEPKANNIKNTELSAPTRD